MAKSIKIDVGVRIRFVGCSWWVDIHRDHRRIRRNLRVLRQEDAEREARLIVSDLRRGNISIESFGLTLKKAVEKYLASKTNYSVCTRRNFLNILTRFVGFMTGLSVTMLEQVTTDHVESFREWAKVLKTRTGGTFSQVTVNNWLTKVSMLFKWASGRGYVGRNPVSLVDRIELDSEKKRPKPSLTTEQIKRLANACSPTMRDFVRLAANTGLRVGEIISLKSGSVKLRDKILTVWNSKAKRWDELKLNRVALEVVRRRTLTSGGGFLFRSSIGSALCRRNVRRDLVQAGLKAGLNVSGPHMLRRSFCSILAKKVSAAVLADMARHEDPRTTARYYTTVDAKAPPTVAS